MIPTWPSSATRNIDAIANQWIGMKDHLAACVVTLHVYLPIPANRRFAEGLIKEQWHVLQYSPCISRQRCACSSLFFRNNLPSLQSLLVMDIDIDLHLEAFSRLSSPVLLREGVENILEE